MSAARLRVKATLVDGSVKHFTGRQAWTLQQLVALGSKGVTPIERPAPRWSDYVPHLRRSGLSIETITEKHTGLFSGTHGRYVLYYKVKLEEIPYPKKTKPSTAATVKASNPNALQSTKGLNNDLS